MDAQLAPAEREGRRPVVVGAALCGFAGSLLRVPLAPLPRIAVALLVGACTAAATVVVAQPRHEQELPVAEAAAGGAAAGQQQQEVVVAAAPQQQLPHDPDQARLEAQLGINEALRTAASPAERAKLVAHSWALRRPLAQKWSLRRLFTSVEVHNMRALSVRAPDLEQARPSELVRFFNRAGMAIPEGLLLPNMTPPHWQQLRAAAQGIRQHWEYQRFKYCRAIKREGLACQAALRLPRLMGAGPRLQTTANWQMEELRQNLLYNEDLTRDISYAAVLPPLDREFVLSGQMEQKLDRISALIPRMLAAEGRRMDGQARRRYDRQEGHDEPPPVARRFDPYVVLNFVPGLA